MQLKLISDKFKLSTEGFHFNSQYMKCTETTADQMQRSGKEVWPVKSLLQSSNMTIPYVE